MIDALQKGLDDTRDNETLHKAVRHSASRGITMLCKYYSLTDDSYLPRFGLRE